MSSPDVFPLSAPEHLIANSLPDLDTPGPDLLDILIYVHRQGYVQKAFYTRMRGNAVSFLESALTLHMSQKNVQAVLEPLFTIPITTNSEAFLISGSLADLRELIHNHSKSHPWLAEADGRAVERMEVCADKTIGAPNRAYIYWAIDRELTPRIRNLIEAVPRASEDPQSLMDISSSLYMLATMLRESRGAVNIEVRNLIRMFLSKHQILTLDPLQSGMEALIPELDGVLDNPDAYIAMTFSGWQQDEVPQWRRSETAVFDELLKDAVAVYWAKRGEIEKACNVLQTMHLLFAAERAIGAIALQLSFGQKNSRYWQILREHVNALANTEPDPSGDFGSGFILDHWLAALAEADRQGIAVKSAEVPDELLTDGTLSHLIYHAYDAARLATSIPVADTIARRYLTLIPQLLQTQRIQVFSNMDEKLFLEALIAYPRRSH